LFSYSTPLKFSEHGQLHVLETNDYSYARGELLAPIVFDEMADVAREYPIVFPDNQTDMPYALMGLEAGQNAYVREDGRWAASYIPLAIRQYPFALQRDTSTAAEDGRFMVMFDPKAPQLTAPHGHPVFTADGQLSEHMKERIKLLERRQKRLAATRLSVQALRAAGVLSERVVNIRTGQDEVRKIGGMQVVDEARLNELPDDDFNTLRRQGGLPLAYAHLLSWANFRQGPIGGKYPDLTARAGGKDVPFLFDEGILRFSGPS
jgi:hypothetical protein